jgi:glycolate oxidase
MAIGTRSVPTRLREVVSSERVIDDPATLLPYSYDASFWSLRQRRIPSAVVVPESTAEVVAVVRVANETGTPLVPRGAGTGQTGGAIPTEGGIVISFARMRKIVEIDRKNLQAMVEPGLVYFDFQNALAGQGLFFPPDPGSGRACTLGGMAANNASGPHAVRWGTTSAYVLGAEVVLADGSVITTGGVRSKALKSSSGIDLTKLFVGSEGTLGIFTRLRLRVQPRPPARAVILAGYRALEDTVASLDDLFEAGILPSTAELLDKSAVDALQLWRPELDLPAGEAVLLIEVEGTPEQVAANVRYTDGIVRRHATVTRFAEDAPLGGAQRARRGHGARPSGKAPHLRRRGPGGPAFGDPANRAARARDRSGAGDRRCLLRPLRRRQRALGDPRRSRKPRRGPPGRRARRSASQARDRGRRHGDR